MTAIVHCDFENCGQTELTLPCAEFSMVQLSLTREPNIPPTVLHVCPRHRALLLTLLGMP